MKLQPLVKLIKRFTTLCAVLIISHQFLLAQPGRIRVQFDVSSPDDPKAKRNIFLAGNFNNWDAANDNWVLVNTPAIGSHNRVFFFTRGDYEYKLTRGSWAAAECAAKGADIPNRKLHVLNDTIIKIKVEDWKDNYAPVEKKHTANKNVHILNAAFNMPQLGKQRRVWLYLPPGYGTSTKKYPVIYMHDGQNLFDEYTSGFGEWGVDEFLDSLKANQPKVIVVGIDHGGDERMTEYSPYDSKYAKGTGDAYARFLVETLKPYIDQHYRTLKDAKHTAVAGSSMGGLISMYATLKYPKVFGSAGIFSPAFWVNPPVYDDAKTQALKSSRFYFVCGDQESEKEVADMNKMVALLNEKGLPAKNIPSTIIKGAKHNEQQWRADFPAFYEWLVKGF